MGTSGNGRRSGGSGGHRHTQAGLIALVPLKALGPFFAAFRFRLAIDYLGATPRGTDCASLCERHDGSALMQINQTFDRLRETAAVVGPACPCPETKRPFDLRDVDPKT
jgi:hypothetical protein